MEGCNNLAVWPCARIILPHSISPLPAAHTPNFIADGHDAAQVAVVDLLRKRLAEEQGAHARTKQETDAEILRLKAMIARRDAELEACATHDAHHVLLSSSAPNDTLPFRVCTRPNCVNGRAAHASGSGLSCHHHAVDLGSETAEADNILARATSRNRVLEREVEILRQTVRPTARHRRFAHRLPRYTRYSIHSLRTRKGGTPKAVSYTLLRSPSYPCRSKPPTRSLAARPSTRFRQARVFSRIRCRVPLLLMLWDHDTPLLQPRRARHRILLRPVKNHLLLLQEPVSNIS